MLPHKDRTKLSARSVLCVFLGYNPTQKGCRCYDPTSRRLYVSCHVAFLECLAYIQLPTTTTTVSKENLVQIDPFPSTVLSDEYISTVTPESLTESTGSLGTTESLPESTGISSPPPLLVYSRCQPPFLPKVSLPASPPTPRW